jgi:S-layer protein (TIGR01567 family)
MKKITAITLTSMMLLLATAMVAGAVPAAEVRGAVAGTVQGASNLADGNSFSWNPQNFAGFFYDIKKDIGNENLKTVLTGDDGRKLSGDAPYGVTYTTTVQQKAYERALWGAFNVIGFQAEQYFSGYLPGTDEATGSNIFYAETTDKNSLASEQLQKILMNSKDEMTVTSGTPLKLGEGYELAVKSIDVDGNKVFLELSKDGAVVDSKVVSPSKDGATELDKTYFYKNPKVGEQAKLVTIAVHFKNAFRGADQNLASVDGIWQISDTPAEVKADTQYGKMTITGIDATTGVITMNNKDEPVTLTKNKDTVLMPGVNIKTADNETLRYYIYKPVTIEGAAGATETAATMTEANATENVTAATKTEAAATEKVAAATTAAAAATEKVAAAKENLTAATEKVAAAKENVTKAAEAAPAAAKKQPGFEGIFAIAGLLAVAYLVIGRKE